MLYITFVLSPIGVLGGFHWGLGVGSGIMVSGLVINQVGIPRTYFIFSLISFAILALFLFAYWVASFEKDTGDIGYKLIETEEKENP